MNREKLIHFLSVKFSTTHDNINLILKEFYDNNKNRCCQELVEEALEEYELVEYRACRVLIEYLFLGEK
jgi:hypothetical protein